MVFSKIRQKFREHIVVKYVSYATVLYWNPTLCEYLKFYGNISAALMYSSLLNTFLFITSKHIRGG